jgi:hypothetical protein
LSRLRDLGFGHGRQLAFWLRARVQAVGSRVAVRRSFMATTTPLDHGFCSRVAVLFIVRARGLAESERTLAGLEPRSRSPLRPRHPLGLRCSSVEYRAVCAFAAPRPSGTSTAVIDRHHRPTGPFEGPWAFGCGRAGCSHGAAFRAVTEPLLDFGARTRARESLLAARRRAELDRATPVWRAHRGTTSIRRRRRTARS